MDVCVVVFVFCWYLVIFLLLLKKDFLIWFGRSFWLVKFCIDIFKILWVVSFFMYEVVEFCSVLWEIWLIGLGFLFELVLGLSFCLLRIIFFGNGNDFWNWYSLGFFLSILFFFSSKCCFCKFKVLFVSILLGGIFVMILLLL